MGDIKDNPDSYHDEMQAWAQRRQEQIDLARQKGGLGWFDKLSYGPGNFASTWSLNSAIKDKEGYQGLGQFDMNKVTDVYQRILDRASQGALPDPDDLKYWESLKRRGY